MASHLCELMMNDSSIYLDTEQLCVPPSYIYDWPVSAKEKDKGLKSYIILLLLLSNVNVSRRPT